MLFGFYNVVEKISLVFMGLFTLFTLLALFMVQKTGFAVTWPDIAEGLSFKLPRATVGFALAAFGLTGVGGDEILSYNYWCIEKGYARFTGPRRRFPGLEGTGKGLDQGDVHGCFSFHDRIHDCYSRFFSAGCFHPSISGAKYPKATR